MDKQNIKSFQKIVWKFYKKNKRSLPWRRTKDPYKILISEVMLQQTQADRVVPYYKKWLKQFPNAKTLAVANFSEIYPLWQGLGYNRRALALQKLAKQVVEKYHGKLPADTSLLEELPGIGPYTARAVSIFSFNRPLTCIETNIRRVFIHHFFEDAESVSDGEILPLLELALPPKKSREWHWALMDYGAYLKTIVKNPNRRSKHYTVQSKFEGSVRQIRGFVLRGLGNKVMKFSELLRMYPPRKNTESDTEKRGRLKTVLETLEKEGLIQQNKNVYSLN